MKVILAHPGTQHSFQLAKQLYKQGLLHEFHTGLAFGKDSLMYKLFSRLPKFIYHKISNRFIDGLPDRYIKRKSLIELKALIKMRLGKDEENILYQRNRQFQLSISDQDILAVDAVIGFDTSSWILAERCKLLSRKFFLDVSIAHPVAKEMVYRRIIKLFPKWEFSLKKKEYKYIAVEEAEMAFASHIVVASSFTLKTYVEQGVEASKISINPYGVATDEFTPKQHEKAQNDPIRFVFVGSVDARKGIPFLLESWSKFATPDTELTLIGPISNFAAAFIASHYPSVIVKGRLPFSEVKRIFSNYDVMVFPSFFEGYGLVIPEAMASGLPVITTMATCGPDIIENQKEGFVIEPGDENGMKAALEFCITHPDALYQMGLNARKKAEELSWDTYGLHWKEILNSF